MRDQNYFCYMREQDYFCYMRDQNYLNSPAILKAGGKDPLPNVS
jgi:hypothetical protein